MTLRIKDERRKPRDTRRDRPGLSDAPGVWSNLNLLVVGPPGSGKMSFLMALTHGLDPTADVVHFDFEVEFQLQERAIATLSDLVIEDDVTKRPVMPSALIFRYLHRLPVALMQQFLAVVSRNLQGENEGGPRGRMPTLRATSHFLPKVPNSLMEELRVLFPCQVHLSRIPRRRADIKQVVLRMIDELNDQYGRGIVRIAPAALDVIQEYAAAVDFHELRNVVERSYFREDSLSLSVESIDAALS